MGRVVLAGSVNSVEVAVIDFTSAASPTVVDLDGGLGSGCTVDLSGSEGALGAINGSGVRGINVANPASPTLGLVAVTQLSGIGAVAVNGSTAAVAEMNGPRVMLVDLAAGTVTASATPQLGGGSSIGWVNASIVAVSGPNDPRVALVDFGASPPLVTYIAPGLAASPVLAAGGGFIAVGDTGGGAAKLFNASGGIVQSVANAAPNGTSSVGLTSHLAVYGTTNGSNSVLVDFNTGTATVFASQVGGGAAVNCSGSVAVCGGVNSEAVSLFDIGVSPPVLLGTLKKSGAPSIGSIALGSGSGGSGPAASWKPPMLAFGAVRVGMSSQLALSITNIGSSPLNVSAIASNAAVFTPKPTTLKVAPGQIGTINVTFAPSAAKGYSGALTFKTDDPAHANVSIPMSGEGGLPQEGISPTSLDLGLVPICQHNTLPVTVSNGGPVPLHVTKASAGAPFSVSPSTLTVPAYGSGVLQVRFDPAILGPVAGVLTIESDDPARPTATVSLQGTGTPEPPPGVSVQPTALTFGDVPMQYFIGLRVTVANTGPCLPLAVALSVSGSEFFVTEGDPTTVPPGSTMVADTVPGGSSKRFVVVFAPQTSGPHQGTLTIASNDPAHPTVEVPLTGNGVSVTPTSIELVLDRSGSMAGAAPGGTRMDALHNAVRLFADIVIAGSGEAMGSVQFDDQHSVLTALAPFDNAQRATLEAGSDSLTPRGMTSIGGGLSVAQQSLSGASTQRKVVIVFTDGLENTPPMIAGVQPGLLSEGVECYAVGLGRPQDISTIALDQLAASAGGKFFLTDDTLVLRKNFVQVLADAFRHNMAADPITTIDQGQALDIPVQITACERRLTFVLMWDDPASQIDLRVLAPDGTVYSPSTPNHNMLVRYRAMAGYRFFQIALPPIDPGSGQTLGPLPIGTWTMRLTGRALSGASERLATQVMVESETELRTTSLVQNVGSPIVIEASVTHNGTPIPDADVWAVVTPPRRSLQSLMTPTVIARALDADTHPLPLAQSRAGKAVKVRLEPVKSKGRGPTHAGHIEADLDGVYHFEVHATGKACGGTFERYDAFDRWVGRRGDKRHSTITTEASGPNSARIRLTPKDASGAPLGPGHTGNIALQASQATITSLRDLGDGSYEITVTWAPKASRPALTISLSDANWSVPLRDPKAKR